MKQWVFWAFVFVASTPIFSEYRRKAGGKLIEFWDPATTKNIKQILAWCAVWGVNFRFFFQLELEV